MTSKCSYTPVLNTYRYVKLTHQSVGLEAIRFAYIYMLQVQEQTVARARSKMQMPPVMNARSNKSVIISDDVEIDGHSKNKYVFTDITFGLRNKVSDVVIMMID